MAYMYNPPHLGETLREDVLPAPGISVTEMARRLGLARQTLSRVLHGRAPVSPDLGGRLERTGIGRARTWLLVQDDYDRWRAEHRHAVFFPGLKSCLPPRFSFTGQR